MAASLAARRLQRSVVFGKKFVIGSPFRQHLLQNGSIKCSAQKWISLKPSVLPHQQQACFNSSTRMFGICNRQSTRIQCFSTLCKQLEKSKEPVHIQNMGIYCQISRRITMLSKRGKRKTCKAVAKRFIRTGKGKLKRWKCGKNHNLSKKRSKTRRQLGKHTYVSKNQLKLLNKMLNGW